MVVDIVTDDMPFLVDSVTMELNRHRADINLILHPRLVVRRDVTGTLHGVAGSVNGATAAPGEITESWIHVEVAGLGDRVSRAGLETGLRRVLDDVRVTVEDQPKMIAAAASLAVSVAGDGAGRPAAGTDRTATAGRPRHRGRRAAELAGRRAFHLPRLPGVRPGAGR